MAKGCQQGHAAGGEQRDTCGVQGLGLVLLGEQGHLRRGMARYTPMTWSRA